MKQVLLIALPNGPKEWILFSVVIVLVIVWIRTLSAILQASFSNRIEKLLWFLFVLFTVIVGVLIYRAWGNPMKVKLSKGDL